jgi:hypothetical protein
MIDGRKPVLYHFQVNDRTCYHAVVVDGLLEQAGQALAEYRRHLAGQHAAVMNRTPADLRNACDVSMYVLNPAHHLQYGFPIREWDDKGYTRVLLDYDTDFQASDDLFVLPVDYQRFSIGESSL